MGRAPRLAVLPLIGMGTSSISCPGSCTVTLVLTLAPGSEGPSLDDYSALFAAVLAALALIWSVKRIMALFDTRGGDNL